MKRWGNRFGGGKWQIGARFQSGLEPQGVAIRGAAGKRLCLRPPGKPVYTGSGLRGYR